MKNNNDDNDDLDIEFDLNDTDSSKKYEDSTEKSRRERGRAPIRSHRRQARPFPAIGLNLHIIILIMIVAIGVFAVVRLLIWNAGTKQEVDTTQSATAFDVEVQDVIVAQDPADLAGREDDGVTTILFLGDDPISDDTGENGIAGQVKTYAESSTSGASESDTSDSAAAGSTGSVEVISAGFPSSRVACINALYDVSDVDDVFNMYYVANAINLNDYTALENAAALHTESSAWSDSVSTLENVDFDKVDIIAFMYDASDYFTESPVMNNNNDDDIQTYTGSMKRSLELINEKYPYIRLVFLSPTYAEYVDDDGNYHSGDTYDLGNGSLPTYWAKGIDICTATGSSFIDNYYGSINETNYKKYLTDNVHLNEAGRALVAHHFVTKIIDKDYSEYDVNNAS